MNQTDIKGKLTNIKGRFKGVINKLTKKAQVAATNQADGTIEGETSLGSAHEFEPDNVLSKNTRTAAQKMVWDNDNASMQDKSYAFDEETTDADYDLEDDFEFYEESDRDSGQTSRYS